MDTEFLIEQGNQHRSDRQYGEALQCYALAFAKDMDSAAAFNNYGNVMREIGHPQRALPFLQHAMILDPKNTTAKFNFAVALLAMGDYENGWKAYESRWQFEHLAGTEPVFQQPRWQGQDLKDKTILVVGEQGHGDNIQFCRFLYNLHVAGAKIKLQVTDGLIPLLSRSEIIQQVGTYQSDMGDFDFWVPIMSIPGILGITLNNLPKPVSYLNADARLIRHWQDKLGPKNRMRIGLSWSGRRDSWLNQHKSVPLDVILDMVKRNPQFEWINLQIDVSDEESQMLAAAGVQLFPGAVTGFHDTAALIMHMDVVISVDTAISHLSGALGRPTWVMLQKFATDWRWLTDRNDSPWYSTARLFRQTEFDNWQDVTNRVSQFLSWFKV